MVTQPRKTFIYGKFVWPAKSKSAADFLGAISPIFDKERIGIEILREFSATELVGKLYSMGGSPLSWVPIEVHTVEEQQWYRWYKSVLARTKDLKKELFSFDVEGSGRWSVLYIRTESDDAGPYVAIALKYI